MNEDNAPHIIPICLLQLLLCKLRCYFCFPFILAGTGIKHFVLSQQGKLPLSSRFRDHIFLVYLWRCYETRISRIFETCGLYPQVMTTANCLAPNKPDEAKWESSILYYPVLQQTASKITGGRNPEDPTILCWDYMQQSWNCNSNSHNFSFGEQSHLPPTGKL